MKLVRRFAGRINARLAVGNFSAAPRDAPRNKSRPLQLLSVLFRSKANSHAVEWVGYNGKDEFRFHWVDDVTLGSRGRISKISGNKNNCYYIFYKIPVCAKSAFAKIPHSILNL